MMSRQHQSLVSQPPQLLGMNGNLTSSETGTLTKSRTPSSYSIAMRNVSANQSSVSLVSMAPTRYTIGSGIKNSRTTKLLVDLWLMSAATFRRLGKLEECRGAISEAENVDADNADVWVQVRLLFSSSFLLLSS